MAEQTGHALVYPHERMLWSIALVLSLVAWIALVAGTFGVALFYILLFWLFFVFAHAALITHLRGNATRIDAGQMPDLYARLEKCCRTLGIATLPEAYLLHGNGVFNAFATRFMGRNYLVLLSDVVDALEEQPGAIDFYIGHELGHIRRRHLVWAPLLAPALLLPLLGAAYSRAREYTCDRHGLACCERPNDALRGMAALAAGGLRWKALDLARFQEQAQISGGFWMSFNEITGSYPWLTKRAAWVAALAEEHQPQLPRRNAFAWLLALFVPHLPGARGLGGMMIIVAIIGILAAIAIPQYQNYLMRAGVEQALAGTRGYRLAEVEYIKVHNGSLPQSNDDIGLPEQPNPPVPGVTAVRMVANGVLDVDLAIPALQGKTLELHPSLANGRFGYICTGDQIPAQALVNCH
jgi:Tfp pilus assembly major pilin PilA/Zn-dependent protease with chaperone function